MSSKKVSDSFKYKNITISGLPGSGSTTLLSLLKENDDLKFAGWTGFSGGEFMRAYAKEKGLLKEKAGLHHSSTAYSDDFDRKVDMGIREKLSSEQGWIIESWLSGFMAQGVKGTLKVLVYCSDKAVKVDRVVNRDGVTAQEAVGNMHRRYMENLTKWQRMYKKQWDEWVVKTGNAKASNVIDFWRANLYDVVIDTYSKNQQETLQVVLDAIKK